MVCDRAFIFHIYLPWDKTFSLPFPESKSSVKVKYQRYSFQKKKSLYWGISVSQTQLVFLINVVLSFVDVIKKSWSL